MSGLRDAFDEIVADVPVYGDLDRAIDQATRDRQRRTAVLTSLGTAAAVLVVIAGVLVVTRDDQAAPQPAEPSTPTATQEDATDPNRLETVPRGPSEVLAVQQVKGGRLEVAGDLVSEPGKWGLNDSRRDVWVAIHTGEDDYESQWWGKGTTAHPMPPSVGSVLRGGVVISEDARWIVWTRPSGDVYAKDPARVMEVVDTATGRARWSREADADAPEIGALAVTNDGVVVFGHCLEPVFDSGGWPQCDDARVDVWAPRVGVIPGAVPAEVTVSHGPFEGLVTSLGPLVRRTGAHNGLLVQDAPSARPQYVRVTARGEVEVVATLPRNTVAVTADERFALLASECPDGLLGCGFTVLSIDDGERRALPSLEKLLAPPVAPYYGYVVEADDLLLVLEPYEPHNRAVGRCSLARARCVPIRE